MVQLVRDFFKKMNKDHVSAYAAQTAYFVMLSFIPFIMLLLTLVQYIPLVTKGDLLEITRDLFPDTIKPILINIIDELYNKSSAIIPVTVITTAWSAGRGILAITRGLNCVYDISETRNYVILRVRSAFYTIMLIVSLILSLVLLVFGNSIHLFLQKNIPILAHFSGIIISMRTLITLAVLGFFFLLLYKFVPNRRATLFSQLPGAVFSAAAWAIFSFGFSLYIDYFSNFSYTYGSLTTLILIMLWLYFCMYIVLIGAEINASFEELYTRWQKTKTNLKKGIKRQYSKETTGSIDENL